MDQRIQIWNVFHDGEITAISEEGGEALTMFVSIPYLRRRMEPSLTILMRQKSVPYDNSLM